MEGRETPRRALSGLTGGQQLGLRCGRRRLRPAGNRGRRVNSLAGIGVMAIFSITETTSGLTPAMSQPTPAALIRLSQSPTPRRIPPERHKTSTPPTLVAANLVARALPSRTRVVISGILMPGIFVSHAILRRGGGYGRGELAIYLRQERHRTWMSR